MERWCIGGLPLPGHKWISLGWRHPSQAGTISVAANLVDGLLRDVDVRSGYGHRGAEKLFEVRDYRSLIMLADRHDWLAAFSGELCVSLAVESAMRLPVPPRATYLRTTLAEFARLHSHLCFLGYLAEGKLADSVWATVEGLRDALRAWTGNRIHPMINRVGGLSADMSEDWPLVIRPLLDQTEHLSTALRSALDEASERLLGLASLPAATCLSYGLSGPVSRATGLDLDRRHSGYLAYGEVFQPVAPRIGADAHDRLAILIDELQASATMIRHLLELVATTPGEVSVRLARRLKVPEGEHEVEVEAPWGIAGCLLVSRGGNTPWRLALRTPSFANLSALGVALEGIPESRIADAVAGIGYSIGDADK